MAKRQTQKTKSKNENPGEIRESDFEDPTAAVKSLDIRKALVGEFGKEILKLAVDELRDEFKQMAMEGGKIGAGMAIHGEDIAELEKAIKQKEKELSKLHHEKTELENELKRQKGRDDELQFKINKIEKEIKQCQDELNAKKRIMKERLKEFDAEMEARVKRERALQSELETMKEKYNKVRSKLGQKQAADNIAREECQKLRQKIEELEEELRRKR